MAKTTKAERDWAWGTAERGFQRALELSPGYATTHHLYSLLLARLGRFDEALEQAETAAALEPFSALLRQNLAYILYLARRPDPALEEARRALAADANLASARLVEVFAYWQKKLYPQAVVESQRALEQVGRRPLLVAVLGVSQALAARRPEAQATLDELLALPGSEVGRPFALGWLHLALGESERGFDWWEKACAEGDDNLTFLKVDPAFDPYRGHARFQGLLRKLNLAP